MAKAILLDASAVLALLQGEPGHELVREALRGEDCAITAANLAEVAGKLMGVVKDPVKMRHLLKIPNLEVWPVTEADALLAGELAIKGKSLGLSLGDRLCLASALLRDAEVLTSDLIWKELRIESLRIRLVRGRKS